MNSAGIWHTPLTTSVYWTGETSQLTYRTVTCVVIQSDLIKKYAVVGGTRYWVEKPLIREVRVICHQNMYCINLRDKKVLSGH